MSEEEVRVVADALSIAMGKAAVAGVDKVNVPADLARAAIAALDKHREASERNGNRPQLTCDERMQMESRRREARPPLNSGR